jgi:hypothetical protein
VKTLVGVSGIYSQGAARAVFALMDSAGVLGAGAI